MCEPDFVAAGHITSDHLARRCGRVTPADLPDDRDDAGIVLYAEAFGEGLNRFWRNIRSYFRV